jgi:hypothetical protein
LDAVLGLPVSQAVLALMKKRRGPKVQPPIEFALPPGARGAREPSDGDGDGTRSGRPWLSLLDIAEQASDGVQRSGEPAITLPAVPPIAHTS